MLAPKFYKTVYGPDKTWPWAEFDLSASCLQLWMIKFEVIVLGCDHNSSIMGMLGAHFSLNLPLECEFSEGKNYVFVDHSYILRI